jgi:hypothetical protein
LKYERALSIRQPWVYLILEHYKDIEIRTWNTKYRGLIALHASKTFDKEGYAYLKTRGYFKDMKSEDFTTGAILGIANLKNVISFEYKTEFFNYKSRHLNDEQWYDGRQKGFILKDVKRIDPIECKGALGIFRLENKLVI